MPGGFGAIGSLVSSVFDYAANKSLQSDSYNNNLDMWNRMNDYNTPSNQVKRLRAAGINPYASMQNGQLSTGSASSPAESVSPPYGDYSPQLVAGMQADSQIDVNRSTSRSLDAESSLKEIDAQSRSIENLQRIENMKKQGLISDEEYERLKTNNRYLDARNQNDLRAADDAHDLAEYEKSIQKVISSYVPQIKEQELNNLRASYEQILSAARSNDAAAAMSYAIEALNKANEEGVKIDNKVKKRISVALVSEAFAKSREANSRARSARADAKGNEYRTEHGEIGYRIHGTGTYKVDDGVLGDLFDSIVNGSWRKEVPQPFHTKRYPW